MTRFSPSLLGISDSLNVESRLLVNTTIINATLFSTLNLNLNLHELNISNGSPLRVTDPDIAVNTQWIDVHDYSNLVITMQAKKNNYYWLIWAGLNELIDINSAITIDEYLCLADDSNAVTKSYTIKAKWLCILTSMVDDTKLQLPSSQNYEDFSSLSFIFKHKPTNVQIGGADNLPASVNLNGNYNALYTMLTDDTGEPLANTGQQYGSVLYTSLSDASGTKLLVENNNLSVALKDVCGNTIDSTNTTSNSLFVCLTDNAGLPQASYDASSDISLNGMVLFYSLQDNSGNNIGTSTSDISNALYITLYNGDNTIKHSINVKTRNEDVTKKIAINSILTNDNLKLAGSELITSDNIDILLHSLNIYNNNNVDIWVKIYDVYNSVVESIKSVEDLHLLDSYLKFNIPVLKDSFRDFNFDKTLTINYGLYAVASNLNYIDTSNTSIINDVYINGTYSTSSKSIYITPVSRVAPFNSSLVSKTTINQFDISGFKGWTKVSRETADASANISYVISGVTTADFSGHVDVSFTTYNVSDENTLISSISSSANIINYPAIPDAIWDASIVNNSLNSGKIYRTDVSLHNTLNESFSIWGSVKNNTRNGRGGYFNIGTSGGAIIYETQTTIVGPTAPIVEFSKTDSTVITCAHRRPYNTFDLSSYITQIDYYSYITGGKSEPVIYGYDASCGNAIITDFSANTYSLNVAPGNLDARIVLIRSNDSSLSGVSGVSIADISISNLTNLNSSLNLTYKSDISEYFGVVPTLSSNFSVKYFSGPNLRGYVYSDASLTCCSFSIINTKNTNVIMKVINSSGQFETVSGYIYDRYDTSLTPAYIKLELPDISLYYTNEGRQTITSNPGQSRLIYLGEGVITPITPPPIFL